MNSQHVFFVSDRTGNTARAIGLSLLSQFDEIDFIYRTYSFVNNQTEANRVVAEIQSLSGKEDKAPIVISTIVDVTIENIIAETDACLVSLFNEFIEPLEIHLKTASSHSSGLPHKEFDNHEYIDHINAIEFTMRNDDGKLTSQFDEADIILVGVSRSAKTPTCLFLAMNFSLKAANYPLTEDDLIKPELPVFLQEHYGKLVGLTIRAEQLNIIRQQRRPNSKYASLEQCRYEVKQAETLMRRASLTLFDTTSISIEEIAVKIAKEKNLLKSKQ